MNLHIMFGMKILFTFHSWLLMKCYAQDTNSSVNKETSNYLVNLLDVADDALHKARELVEYSIRTDQQLLYSNPMDCAEIYDRNSSSRSGIYKVWPRSRFAKVPIDVYCDMEDDGGAWTVIQRRGDFDSAKDYFYRDWINYKIGFGDLLKDFWIGNDNIFSLTNERSNLVKFNLRDWEENATYAIYDDFWIDDEDHNYTMHVAGYRGIAGDGFTTNGLPFTTKDRDHDKHPQNCADRFKGAWWYAACHSSNLNGLYLKGVHESYADGVNWRPFRGNHYSLKDTAIKIRPKDFIKKKNIDMTPE